MKVHSIAIIVIKESIKGLESQIEGSYNRSTENKYEEDCEKLEDQLFEERESFSNEIKSLEYTLSLLESLKLNKDSKIKLHSIAIIEIKDAIKYCQAQIESSYDESDKCKSSESENSLYQERSRLEDEISNLECSLSFLECSKD